MSTESGWVMKAIDRRRGVEILHRHLEAEILGRLVADRFHDRVGHADVAQLNVLDLLRPDGRKTGNRAGPGRAAEHRAAGFQERTPRRALLCSGAMTFHVGIASRLTGSVWIFAHDCLPARNASLRALLKSDAFCGGVFLV